MLIMSMNHKKRRKKIVFFGDSITEYGARPGGYITVIRQLIREETKEDSYELAGEGRGGNKIDDLYARMNRDVLSKGADVVVVFVGVNDVNHKFSGLTGTDIDTFKTTYTAIIDKLQAAQIKVVLCTPAAIGERPDHVDEANTELNRYSDVIRNLADSFNLPLVDLRHAFLNYNALYNPEHKDFGVLTNDKIHLNEAGNRLVAAEMWKVLRDLA
jgi:lysophospholipase L1-like esterase